MNDSTSTPEPILSVPEVIFPETHIGHKEVIERIRQQYQPLLIQTGDEEYQRNFIRQVETALRMCGALSIDVHPVHLPFDEIVRPRGWRTRNAQALEAFLTYVPLAAKQAMATAQVPPEDIDAVLVETSTVISMPALAFDVIDAAGLRPSTSVMPISFMGCNGGAHAIVVARNYLLAHPTHRVLVIAADYASPWFHVERELRGNLLRGSVVSSALFSDATAAAVMSSELDTPGFRVVGTSSASVPGTREALAWEVADDGLHFRLTDTAMKLVPDVVSGLHALLAQHKWRADELSVCSFHSGGDRIIRNVQESLGLTDSQVEPTRKSLRRGNTMSVAVFDALRIIASDPSHRPPHGGRGIGAGFGPGFSCSAFAWTYQGQSGADGHVDMDTHCPK